MRLLLYILLFALFSCSTGQRQYTSGDDIIIEVNPDSESISSLTLYDEPSVLKEDQIIEEKVITTEVNIIEDKEIPEVVFDETTQKKEIEDKLNQLAYYTVSKGETLMTIAYKIYGNFHRLNEMRALNDLQKGAEKLEVGMQIKYIKPDHKPIRPKGKIYIIREGDYISKITNYLYDNRTRLWPWLWENNKDIYPDPNNIYCGLPLYYLPLTNEVLAKYGYKTLKERGLASE